MESRQIRVSRHAYNRYLQRIDPSLRDLPQYRIYRSIIDHVKNSTKATEEELTFIRYSRKHLAIVSSNYNEGVTTYISPDYVAFVLAEVEHKDYGAVTLVKTCYECRYLKMMPKVKSC